MPTTPKDLHGGRADDPWKFNKLQKDQDVIVYGSGSSTPILQTDAANLRVGIGTATPAVALDVAGAITCTGALTVGSLATTGDLALTDDDSLVLGTGLDVELLWSTADASNHAAVLALGASQARGIGSKTRRLLRT